MARGFECFCRLSLVARRRSLVFCGLTRPRTGLEANLNPDQRRALSERSELRSRRIL